MIEFVFMLTHHDRTVGKPLDVYAEIRDCGLRYIGFKDVGATVAELREVCAQAHADGLEVMLEVVSTTKEDELSSIAAAAEIGVDWVLGGTHPQDGVAVLAGTTARYCPFPGTVVGHPSVLLGEIDQIADSARAITALNGVHGLDLLAYRHPTADVAALTRAVVSASAGPVIAAGSVATLAQIATLDAAGAWGFTIGGAIFECLLPGGPSVSGQIRHVLAAAAGRMARTPGPAGDPLVPAVILAVDQGSSSSRCVALDSAMTPIAVASRPLASAFPAAGQVTHDAVEIVTAVLAVTREALARAGAGWPDVAGIGLAAQTETFVVWDRSTGQPVAPAVSWRDTRASDACDELRAAGHEATVRSRTGLPLEPAFSASKLRWLLAEIPGALQAAASGQLLFGDVGCWLTWQLSGGAAHVTDPSMASRTMLFDLASGSWDPELLALFGIPRQMLPDIVPTAGRLAVTDAAVCGGRAPVSAIAGDQQAALFGQRCWREGLAKLTLGTGAFLWCNAGARPAAAPAGVVCTCAWQIGEQRTYALEGFVPNAGGVIGWLRQLGVLGADAWPLIRAGALLRHASAGRAGGPRCVPALFGLGTPRWTPIAQAEFGGLTADSTGADLAEAALIGVVHQIVDAIDAVRAGLSIPLAPIRVDGGLGRNDSVLRAIADLSGITLERTAATEVTALGAGMLAGLGSGLWDTAELAAVPPQADYLALPELSPGDRDRARSQWQRLLADAVDRWQRQAQLAAGGTAEPGGSRS